MIKLLTKCFILLTGILVITISPLAYGGEEVTDEVKHLDDMVVKEKAGAPGLEQSPSETIIEIDKFTTIGPQTSVMDVLKTQAIVDFRGESGLDPGVDSIYLRGFDSKRFVTAIDSLTVQKTGGRKSSNIVDYALMPTFLIEKVEILPGPHSALYDSKSIGGVVNMISKKPRRYDTLKPDLTFKTSYGSYDTVNSEVVVQGAVNVFTYDMAYKKYSTNGYLRNNETDIDTVFSRFGLLLPADGFAAFSVSYSEVGREAPVNNPGSAPPYETDYNSNYPKVSDSPWDPVQKPTWDGRSYSYRLNIEQPSPIGNLTFGGYYGEDNRERAYEEWNNSNNHALGTYHTIMDTDWWQQGGKIQDEIKWTDNHITTVGYDMVKLYDDGLDDRKTKRIHKNGGYVQHQWAITPSVDLRLGMRYEDVGVWVTNTGTNSIPGRDEKIKRNWDELMPKSFATWKMDQVAPWLRDTSLSAGISKIWRAPDYHGDYNPQGRPAGAWLEPEHGIGYDLVFNRRLFRDINFKLNYAFYEIKDFIATNSTYANYTGASAGSLRYSDYKVNLEKVYRHGVDVEMGGHLTDALSFYLTYAWQIFENEGNEPAAETELDQRARNRVGAGLRYALYEKTTLMMDYYYQSEETTEISEEIAEDVWDFRNVDIDEYHIVDIGVQQTLVDDAWAFKNVTLNVYVKNLFDKEYYDTSGYRATDMFFGVSFSAKM
ncbi:MAG: TonB-dependent receptor [Proteobacteria bacterium]|nr:TonB-dependent receptor [Pseudomonadota bacterium]